MAHYGAMDPLVLSDDWIIPSRELRATFVRSSGPGGQNVNKLSTKVELRFAFDASENLSPSQKQRLMRRHPSHVNRAGELIITCDETRSQATNLELARQRLRAMVLEIRRAPRTRRPTRPSRSSIARRLDDKRRRSVIKKQRSGSE